MNIGEVIKEYRTKGNMTQEELAAKLNLTPQAVSRWETGISYPDIAILPDVARVLHVSTDILLSLAQPASVCKNDITNKNEEYILNQSEIDCVFDYVACCKKQEKEKVLIIDDAEFMRNILTNILNTYGYEVEVAKDGEEGLSILEKHTFDICILDIGMPGMNGIEVLSIIRKMYPDIRVVMLSAQSTNANVHAALQFGAYGFVAKPFSESVLREHLN